MELKTTTLTSVDHRISLIFSFLASFENLKNGRKRFGEAKYTAIHKIERIFYSYFLSFLFLGIHPGSMSRGETNHAGSGNRERNLQL